MMKHRLLIFFLCAWVSPIGLAYFYVWPLGIIEFGLSKYEVAEITSLFLTVLGVSIAILIAVFTAVYVQSRTKRESGFSTFFASLGDFTALMVDVSVYLRHMPPRKPEGCSDWSIHLEVLMDRLHAITPSWKGCKNDSGLLPQFLLYAPKFNALCSSLGEDFDRTGYPMKHDLNIKGMLSGILTMDEAIEGYRTSRDLLLVGWMLTLLLATCIIVRVVAGSDLINGTIESAFLFNSWLVLTLFFLLVFNIGGAIFLIFDWQREVQKQDSAWA